MKIVDPRNKSEYYYHPGEVVKLTLTKKSAQVAFTDGKKIVNEEDETNSFPFELILPRTEKNQKLIDLILMKHINEPEIANTLMERYECDEIYTYCGTSLISINPYCLFEGEYSLQKKLKYKNCLKSSFFILQKIQPHIYSLALSSVHEIIYDDSPCSKLSICLGGESGSGKTEASLYCLDFIVFCYNENPEPKSIESRVSSASTDHQRTHHPRGLRQRQDDAQRQQQPLREIYQHDDRRRKS